MPVMLCPRCQRANPVGAAYCHFDGGSLLSSQDGGQRLAHDFIFPSGRRCRTMDDFALGCQDEWLAARDLLAKDAFRQFFVSMGRHDLARLALEAMQLTQPDLALSRFINGLPVARTHIAKLDFQPRRFTLGRIPTGDPRPIEVVLVNQGQGTLQGTVSITEGNDWLSFADQPGATEVRVGTAREQRIPLLIDTRKLKAAQAYAGQLMIAGSGGVAEVPIRFELVAKPFAKAPFQGVRTPRELAEKMRSHPKQAGPMLEVGDVEKWFAANNWDYPVQGPVAKGLAGVQQFFEAMGLSRPPQLQLSQKEVRFTASYPDPVRFQIAVQTTSRKWVYGQVTSNQTWMKVLTPKVIGPQHANILLEADPTLIVVFPPEECRVQVMGNGGQKLDLRVLLDVKDAPRPPEKGRWLPVAVFAILFVLLRLLLIPVVDWQVRSSALKAAAFKAELTVDASFLEGMGWLRLPWVSLLAGFDAGAPLDFLGGPSEQPNTEAVPKGREFRHYFVGYFVREVVLLTWWLGPLAALLTMIAQGRSEGTGRFGFIVRNAISAILAGGVAGVVFGATVACLFLAVEIVPHVIWSATLGKTSGLGILGLWFVVALVSWAGMGALLGFVISLIPPLRAAIFPWPQALLVGLFRLCRLQRLEKLIRPKAA